MSWMLSIWTAAALLALCGGQGYGLCASGYHLCVHNETKSVSFLVMRMVSYTEAKPCGGWLSWKTCTVTLHKLSPKTENRTVVMQVAKCCDGYVQVGRYCALPVNRSREFAAKPGTCPTADGLYPGCEDCEWDMDCPGWQKCCQKLGRSLCAHPESSANDSYIGGYRLNVTVTVKVDYQDVTSKDNGLLNHTRILQAMVTGALQTDAVSLSYLSSWPVHPYRTATSLLIGCNSTLSLSDVSSKLHLLLKHIQEVSSVTVEDVDECVEPAFPQCSPQADCNNTVGSYRCICRQGYSDVDPSNPGAYCTRDELWTETPVINTPSMNTDYTPAPNTAHDSPGNGTFGSFNSSESSMTTAQSPLLTTTCSPPNITALMSSNVTGTSFCVSWSSRFQANQTYQVVLSKGSVVIDSWETDETMKELRGLEPGVLYKVAVTPCACGSQGAALDILVKTDCQTLDATARLTNINFTADLRNTSSEAYMNLTTRIEDEIYESLSPEMKAMVDSGLVRFEITNFSQGSVVVNIRLVFSPRQSDITNVSNALLNSLMNSSKYTVDENNTRINDFDECTSGSHDCSRWANCTNSWGSYTCVCNNGFTDNNPDRPGRVCTSITTSETMTPSVTATLPSTVSTAVSLLTQSTSDPVLNPTTHTPAATTTITNPTTTMTNSPTSISAVTDTTTIIATTTAAPVTTTVTTTTINIAPITIITTPITTTTSPVTTTTNPITTTTITATPITTSTAPVTTTTNPITTTTITATPITTSAAPVTTTTVPITTSAAPVTTTTNPITTATITAPVTITATPVTTTTVPITTSTAPVTTATTPITTTTINTAPVTITTTPITTTTVPITTSTAPVTNATTPITTTIINTAPVTITTTPITTTTVPITTSTAPVTNATTPITTTTINTAPVIITTTPVTTTTVPITTSTAQVTTPVTTTAAPAATATTTTPITTTTTTLSPTTTSAPPIMTTPALTSITSSPSTNVTTTTTNTLRRTTSMSGAISVYCGATVMTVTVAKAVLQDANVRENDLYLGLSECGVNGGNATHVQLTVAWDECDTVLVQNETHYTASVTLFNTMANDREVAPTVQLEVPIMCTYPRRMVISAASGSTGYDTINDVIVGLGSFQVRVQLMNGTAPLPSNYSLSAEEQVVVEVSLNTSSEQIKVVINKCWATSTPNPADTRGDTFLDNGCPMNRFTTVLSNGNSSTSRVSVQIFSVVNLNMIYLHCQVYICVQIGSDTCVPDCQQRTARSSRTVSSSVGTVGPLFKLFPSSFQQEYDTAHIIGFACLGVGLSLFFLVSFVCLFYYHRNRIGHYNFNVKPKQESFTYLNFNT